MTASRSSVPTIVISEPEDRLMELLDEVQVWIVRHPDAARAMARALISEGQRFAKTSSGRRWHRRLADSELLRRARIVWDSSLLSSLDAPSDAPLPSSVVDTLVSALMASDLRDVVSQLSQWGLADA